MGKPVAAGDEPTVASLRDRRADVTKPGELEGGAVRASDDERTRITDQLRVHCVAARITVEELERPLEQAMSALSVRELATLVHDLPRTVLPVAQPTRPEVRAGLPGVRPFTFQLVIPTLEGTRVAALEHDRHGPQPQPLGTHAPDAKQLGVQTLRQRAHRDRP
jgi:hypothetical protein